MFDPIINPTLKNANFGPKILVKPKDIMVNKISIVEINKKSFLIKLDLHKKSYMNHDKSIDSTEYNIAEVGDIRSTLLSTINTPAL
tara:strand:+ start:628 stop:885 length:258 start_codon:yes stop_codon:yes gene_type:complete